MFKVLNLSLGREAKVVEDMCTISASGPALHSLKTTSRATPIFPAGPQSSAHLLTVHTRRPLLRPVPIIFLFRIQSQYAVASGSRWKYSLSGSLRAAASRGRSRHPDQHRQLYRTPGLLFLLLLLLQHFFRVSCINSAHRGTTTFSLPIYVRPSPKICESIRAGRKRQSG